MEPGRVHQAGKLGGIDAVLPMKSSTIISPFGMGSVMFFFRFWAMDIKCN